MNTMGNIDKLIEKIKDVRRGVVEPGDVSAPPQDLSKMQAKLIDLLLAEREEMKDQIAMLKDAAKTYGFEAAKRARINAREEKAAFHSQGTQAIGGNHKMTTAEKITHLHSRIAELTKLRNSTMSIGIAEGAAAQILLKQGELIALQDARIAELEFTVDTYKRLSAGIFEDHKKSEAHITELETHQGNGTRWSEYPKRMLPTTMPFDNEARSRYYGIRKGDTIKNVSGKIGLVVEYGLMDNNCVHVDYGNGPIAEVAEWCKIVKRVDE